MRVYVSDKHKLLIVISLISTMHTLFNIVSKSFKKCNSLQSVNIINTTLPMLSNQN